MTSYRRMRRQTLCIGENRGVGGKASSGRARHLLVGCPADEIERAESRVAARETTSRQDVIAASDVIPKYD